MLTVNYAFSPAIQCPVRASVQSIPFIKKFKAATSGLKQSVSCGIAASSIVRASAFRRLVQLGVAAVVLSVLFSLNFVAVPRISAQTTEKHLPSFDVASIRQDRSGNDSMSISVNSNRYTARDVFVKTLLVSAFQVEDFQIVGAPGWADSDRYTVDAKFPEGIQKLPMEEQEKQIALMIQSLLVYRFSLHYHRTTKPLPVYSLVLGKSGPKLLKAKPGEPSLETVDSNTITARAYSMSDFARQLSLTLHRTVQDNTGLKGQYSFTLHYAPDQNTAATDGQAGSAELDAQARLFSAIQEQLGLKLVSQRGQVPIIVIDHIDRPSPN